MPHSYSLMRSPLEAPPRVTAPPTPYRPPLLLLFAALSALLAPRASASITVGVYGSTVCAVSACVAAARMNVNCTMVEPTAHLFGMTTGGLSGVDLRMPIGGIALEIFGSRPFPNSPPSHLNATIRSLLARAGPGAIRVESRAGDILRVEKSGARITAVHFSTGLSVSADYFIDCSYEGDLLRLAGASFTVGREAATEYNESLAGVNAGQPWGAGSFPRLSPWADAANTTLLPTIVSVVPPGVSPSAADGTVMAMNYRLCLTNNVSNRLPFTPPPGYTPAATEVLRRYFTANAASLSNASLLSLFLVRDLGESKIDVNDREILPNTADLPFLQAPYPLANWSQRAAICAAHEWYIRAAWEFLRSDPVVPPTIRADAATWGLPADEFVETGGFPPQIYVRESVRLRGEVVMTQADVFGATTAANNASVGLSQWLVDIHNVVNMAAPPALTGRGWELAATGRVNTQHGAWQLTEVPFGALLPRRGEVANLAVPVCASFTHVAFSTYRLEPQYAVFGQSAGVAAVLAGRAGGVALQDLNITALQAELRAQGQLLDAASPSPPTPPIQKLILAPCTAAAQQWRYFSTDGSLEPSTTGLCASVFGYSNSTGARVVSAGCHTGVAPHNQAFDLETVPSGGVRVRSRMSQLCVAPASAVDGAELVQSECGGQWTTWGVGTGSPSPWELKGAALCVITAT